MKEISLSPMMIHYKSLKEKYTDAILMYRLGDFYEMFFDDAIKASKILDLTLTGRDCGLAERAPMCGVPYHAVDNYIARLIASGNKVAICEQLSEVGDQKGMVKRDVIRVITAGTVIEEDMLDNKSNNFLAAVYVKNNIYAVSWLDITTGEFKVKDFDEKFDALALEDFLMALTPSEIIGNAEIVEISRDFISIQTSKLVKISHYYDYAFDFDSAKKLLLRQMNSYDLSALGLENKNLAVSAAGGLLDYVNNTQKRNLSHINQIKYMRSNDSMFLDYNTKRNLELFESLADKKRYGSLLWVIDNTKTSMGARQLKSWLNSPLQNVVEIEKRQEAVAELIASPIMRESLSKAFGDIRDIERIVTKISYFSILPRDCLALKESIGKLPEIKKILAKAKSGYLSSICEKIENLEDLYSTLDKAVLDDPPATLKDGGIFKKGYDIELDSLRALQNSGKRLIAAFEVRQKEETGISSLKLGYNRIFGYYIEIPKKADGKIPFSYVRKQTIAGGERYTTEELDKLQGDILGAAEKSLKLETELFARLRDQMSSYILKLQKNAFYIAYLDCLYSLSEIAIKNNYVRPKINDKINHIKIIDGRHPVVEELLKANEFVPNDTVLNNKDSTMMIITGPNMAGKSTYIRQVAIIVLLAHIGSFVPASQAEISIVDRIFTRVGASDNLVQGQSTFMVEMLEVANIINNATSKSLLILDEIGRGTSTLDGLSIAWAIVEYIALKIKAKTLFATHYHELSEIENLFEGIKNYRILVQDNKNTIAFIYKIARGSANKSYGIEVAALAGVKKEITERARDIMNTLAESHELSGNLQEKLSANPSGTATAANQMSFFEEDPKFVEMKRILNDLNINRCTPIEALTILSDLKKLLEKR